MYLWELKTNYFLYRPGARDLLRIENTHVGSNLIKKVITFQVFVGTHMLFPLRVASTASCAILFASFFIKTR